MSIVPHPGRPPMSMIRERALKQAKRDRAVACIESLITQGMTDHRSDVTYNLGDITKSELRDALELLQGMRL